MNIEDISHLAKSDDEHGIWTLSRLMNPARARRWDLYNRQRKLPGSAFGAMWDFYKGIQHEWNVVNSDHEAILNGKTCTEPYTREALAFFIGGAAPFMAANDLPEQYVTEFIALAHFFFEGNCNAADVRRFQQTLMFELLDETDEMAHLREAGRIWAEERIRAWDWGEKYSPGYLQLTDMLRPGQLVC